MSKFNTALHFLERIVWKLPYVVLGLTVLAVVAAASSFYVQIHQNWWFQIPSEIGDFQTQPYDNWTKNVLGSGPGCVFVTLKNSSILCLSPRSGKLRWQTWLAEPSSEPPKALENDSTTIFSTAHGGFYALNVHTGHIVWQFQTSTGSEWQLWNLSNDQQNIIALDRQNTLFVIEALTGKVRWSKTVTPAPAPALTNSDINRQFFSPFSTLKVDDQNIYWANFTTGVILALNLKDGSLQWQKSDYALTQYPDQDLFVVGNHIWYQNNAHELIGVSAETGIPFNQIALLPGTAFNFTAHSLIVHDETTTLRWYNLETGKLERESQLPARIKAIWFDQDTLLAQLTPEPFQETIAVLDEATSQVRWQTAPLGLIQQTISTSDHQLVVAGANGKIRWLDLTTGATLNETLVVGQPSFFIPASDSPEQSQLWVLSKHPGSFGKTLVDVTFFDKPGRISAKWQDLAVDPTTAFFSQNRLWLVSQDHFQLISLRPQAWQPNWFKLLKPIPTKLTLNTRPLAAFPAPPPTTIDTGVAMVGDTCLATWNFALPAAKSPIIDQLMTNRFNPWADIQLTVTLTQKDQPPFSISGYYDRNRTWRAVAALPHAGEWQWQSHLSGPGGWQQTATGSLTTPAASQCHWDFLQLNADRELVTPQQQLFWSMGLQDGIFDFNDDGTIFDQWLVGKTAQPPTEPQTIQPVPFTTYLDTYAQAGFGLYRLSLDNFSFKLWHNLAAGEFHGSVQANQWAETMLQELKRRHFRVLFSVFGFQPVKDTQATQAYLDYVINRFSPYVDIWEIGNETWPDEQWVNFAANYLKAHDPYHHPVTISWNRSNLPAIDLTSQHYYATEPQTELSQQFMAQITQDQQWHKPVLLSEFGNGGQNWDATSAERLRIRMWLSAWQKVPLIAWNHSGFLFTSPGNANLYLGPIERQFVRANHDWLNRYSDLNLKPVLPPATTFNCYGQTDNQTTLLLYCLHSDHTLKTTSINVTDWLAAAQLPGLTAKKWQVTWFDPATGKVIRTDKTMQPQMSTPAFTTDLVSEWRPIE